MINKKISLDRSITPQLVELQDVNMHYLTAGKGDPILFLHGIPTWSYLWRNILPLMADCGQCIAPDLIGMGYSDKPKIDYTVFDHIRYINAFIEALNLKNITLVLHGWGSVIGFDYAMQHVDNIKGIAFIESNILPAVEKDMVALPVQERASILQITEDDGNAIMDSDYYINKLLPAAVMRKLSKEELQRYRMPFNESGSAKPIWQYLQDLPLGNEQTPVVDLIATYSQKLQQSNIPKLMIYAMPGFNTSMNTVAWAKQHLPNLALVEIDDALHYVPESHPAEVATALINWYQKL